MFLTLNEDTKPGMLTCTDTKICFHKFNFVIFTQNSEFMAVIFFFQVTVAKDQVVRNGFHKYQIFVNRYTFKTGLRGLNQLQASS